MGGRIAEDLTFGQITSGASNDIERATELARSYVCKYGMSNKLGPRKYGKSQEHVFLGKDFADSSQDYSESTSQKIDEEIKSLLEKCYSEAEKILLKNKKDLIYISKLLMEKEVIEGKEFLALLGINQKALKPKKAT